MKKRALFISVWAVLLWSCERIIPFTAEDSDPLITLYTSLEPGSPVDAFVSRTVGILDQGEPILLNEATVWAEDENGLVLDTLTFIGLGVYRSANLVGQEGQTYEIHASNANLPPVSGSAKIPMIPVEGAVDSLDAFDGSSGGPGPGSMPYVEYSFQIIDDGEPGYYQIEGYERLRGTTTIPDYPMPVETDDPWVNGSGFGQEKWLQRIDISNESFLGSSHTMKIRVYQWDQMSMEILFKLKKVDEATYFYARSLDQYQQTNGNPFTQPVAVYSNVSNGLGVVSGMAYRWIRP